MQKTAVFTIVSSNYWAFARTLMQSLAEVHPEWDRHVLLVDRLPYGGLPDDGLFLTTTVEELPLPRSKEFLFRYTIMELNTAVKPWMFAHLRQKGYQRVVYLDPDIFVVQPLADVERMLEEGATAVLTPHLTAPLPDQRKPTELDIMRAGAYNLGFLAVGDSAQADQLIAWWQQKLEYQAVVDFEQGLFTDQKWLDLAPGMFEGMGILRDTGYNVAYWNLAHRPLTREGERWYAGGKPLRFFHFSGFDPEHPGPFSKHQNRFDLESLGAGKELALHYASRLLANGYREYRSLPYAFGSFDDGTAIPAIIRAAYRECTDLQKLAGGNPFAHVELFVEVPPAGLPPLLQALLIYRRELAGYFAGQGDDDRQAMMEWFLQDNLAKTGIPERFILPIKKAVAANRTNSATSALQSSLPRHNLLSWGGMLEYLHYRWTGNHPSPQRLKQYRSISTVRQFLSLGRQQANRYFHGRAKFIPSSLRQSVASATLERSDSAGYRPRLLPPGVQSFGFYPAGEEQAWWMGREAGFVVSDFRSGLLRVEGIHHAVLFQKTFGVSGLAVDIMVNGSVVSCFELHEEGPFNRDIDLNCKSIGKRVEILLVPRQSIVPRDAGISDDGRCLSLQISRLQYQGEQIVIEPADEPVTQEACQNDLPGVNVIGYVRSEHGLGQSPRLFSAGLQAVSQPHVLIDFNIGNASRTHDTSLEHLIVEHPRYPVNVFHINADQMPVVCQNLSAEFFKDRYNIGFWHWELPELPDAFLNGFNGLNEVWVPTGFVHDAVSKKSPVPVVKIPHAIQFVVEPCTRADFGLPEQRFLFLTMYDFSSYQERKNPKGALDAFDRAFDRTDNRVALVIKTQNSHHHPQAREELQAWLEGRENVAWLDRTLTRQEVYNLESLCDSYLSLHRSEGFGLGPAEAMYLGKPVIATNWSGTTEFMRQDNSLPVNYELITLEKSVGVYGQGQTWAAPDIDHASRLMRQVVDDRELCQRIGRAAQHSIRTELSPLRIGRMQQERLNFIQMFLR